MTSDEARKRLEELTEREAETVLLVARGLRGSEIARQMGLSELTVKTYKKRATQKLRLNMYAICALVGKAGMA